MRVRKCKIVFVALSCIFLAACGSLRFSQVAPGIEEFHPQRICIFPVNPGVYKGDAGDVVDDIIADLVKGNGWFSAVVSPQEVLKNAESDRELKDAVDVYLAKLRTLSFADPELGRYIASTLNIDAFLVVDVDFWNYTTQEEDKIVKAGFSMKLVSAQTGEVMWRASHCDEKKYRWIKPDLTDFAASVAKDIISYMPH